jgi:hypothetical protein
MPKPPQTYDKRGWIYAGLGLAPGVGLVRVAPEPGLVPANQAPTKLLPSGQPVRAVGTRVLVGDAMAAGLGPAVGALARDQGMRFAALHVTGSDPGLWATDQALIARVRSLGPVVLVASFTGPWKNPLASGADLSRFCATYQKIVSRIIWLEPPASPLFPDPGVRKLVEASGLRVFPTRALRLPLGPDGKLPTAAGQAALAGTIWRWIR